MVTCDLADKELDEFDRKTNAAHGASRCDDCVYAR